MENQPAFNIKTACHIIHNSSFKEICEATLIIFVMNLLIAGLCYKYYEENHSKNKSYSKILTIKQQ